MGEKKKKVIELPGAVVPAVPLAAPAVEEMALITLTKAEAVGIITNMLGFFLNPPENFSPQITFPAARIQRFIPKV
jgi:hypothetical protein